MAALRKTTETMAEAGRQPTAPKALIGLATSGSEPIDSAAQQLQLHLEAALTAAPTAPIPDPLIFTWPLPVRGAILAGAIFIPWALIALAVKAVLR
jgi:hypothetical protein